MQQLGQRANGGASARAAAPARQLLQQGQGHTHTPSGDRNEKPCLAHLAEERLPKLLRSSCVV
jgi:hypothetical protein